MPTPSYPVGRLLCGSVDAVQNAYAKFNDQPIDIERLGDGSYPFSTRRTTIGGTFSVSGPGTFRGKVRSTLTFRPLVDDHGWWIDRTDQPGQFPIPVSVRSVWTTARNIVLRSGSPHNYLRMVEHIIAYRLGAGIDDLVVETASGDPPLFDRGNLDIYEGIDRVGIMEKDEPAPFCTVREPLTFGGARGDFLTFLPAEPGQRGLRVDCAVDFNSAIGKQRLRFDLSPSAFRTGSEARTNAPYSLYAYVKTIGRLFADTRNLGYTRNNILIHGKKEYFNKPNPNLSENGRSYEAVWHRSTLDLLAAVSLLDAGRFAGTIVSYRAGHTQDVVMCSMLQLQKHIVPLKV